MAGLVVLLLLCLTLGRSALGAWAAGPEEQALRAAWERARTEPGYRFTSHIDQTLVPVASAATIGQASRQVDLVAEGTVQAPDRAEVRISMDGQPLEQTMGLLQDGARTFLRKDEKLVPMASPAGGASPTGDYLGFLSAATQVREIEPTTAAGHSFRRFSFELDGQRLAEHLQRQLGDKLPAGIQTSPVPQVAQITGSGTLWVDEAGLPRRQILDLTLPRASADYSAQVHVDSEFRDFGTAAVGGAVQDAKGEWRLQAPAGAAGTLGGESSLPDRLGAALAVAGERLAEGLLVLLALVIAGGLGRLAYARRRHRHVYTAIVVVTLVSMVFGPMIKVFQVGDFMAEQRAGAGGLGAATALAQTLGGAEAAEAAAPVALEPAAPLGLAQAGGSGTDIKACGQGSTSVDTDVDGLSDFEEGCRGTDPYSTDSDGDLLPDRDEVTGFSVGGKTWYGDPNNVDAGGDELVDAAEWPKPVGQGPRQDTNLDGTVTDEEAWDPDGDGVPNIWDGDNDGDDVSDAVDLSPFARTALVDSYVLQTQGGGTDGTQYIELQVQPGNADHLRANVSALDWPADEKGPMQDLDNSAEDLRLFPMLVMQTNFRPDPTLAARYGIGTVDAPPGSADPYRIYAPLLPVTENGRITAFYARVAYPPAQQAQIRWRSQMVWVVQGSTDQDEDTNTKDNVKNITTTTVPLHTYEEDKFRVVGLNVERSQSSENALFATPSLPDDDRQLFNLLIGLNGGFVDADRLTLDEIQNRFTQPFTPAEEKWGVTAPVVVDKQFYAHRDEGIADTSGRRLSLFLDTHYQPTDTATVLQAYEQVGRGYSLDQVGKLDPGEVLNINLADAPLMRTRGLTMALYKKTGGQWQALSDKERDEVMAARYADVSDSLADLQPIYPDLTAANLQGVVREFYRLWSVGRVAVVTVDALTLVAQELSDNDLTTRLGRNANVTLDAYLVDVAELAEPGAGLRIGVSVAGTRSFVRTHLITAKLFTIDIPDTGISLNLVGPEIVGGKKTLKLAGSMRDWKTAVTVAKNFKALPASSQLTTSLFKAQFKARAAGAIVSLIMVGYIWSVFSLTTDFANPIAVRVALVTALVATLFTAFMFVISLNPIGGLLTMLFYLVDWVVFLVTEGEYNITGIVTEAIADFFYGVNSLTEVTDAHFTGITSGLISPERGYQRGNQFEMYTDALGTIKKMEDGSSGDLTDSWVTGDFHVSSTRSDAQRFSGPTDCVAKDGATLDCRTEIGAIFALDEASRDVDITSSVQLDTVVYYEECTLSGLLCARRPLRTKYPSDAALAPSTFWLDVLPNTVEGLTAWNAAPVVAGHVFNPDQDGDARPDRLERSAADCASPATQNCTRFDRWDSDGDGLPDGFEANNATVLSVDATRSDSDQDGLSDGEELARGTQPGVVDTDGDGLADAAELLQPGDVFWTPTTPLASPVGGWLMRIPGGALVPVLSDPTRADADGDGLNDAVERANQTSPFAANTSPSLVLTAGPQPPAGAPGPGLYVTSGTPITLRLDLASVGPRSVEHPMTLCLPGILSGITGGDLGNGLKPTVSTGCEGDPAATLYTWPFSVGSPFQLGAVTFTTFAATASAPGTSRADLRARLPYYDGLDRDGVGGPDLAELSPVVHLTVDGDLPTVAIVSPANGDILGGGTSSYVVGGTAADVGSWVTAVQLTLPAGGGTVTAAEVGPWAHTWTLPADGVHSLSATATDATGHTSAASTVSVTVDNTAPVASFTSPADGAFITDPTGAGATVALAGTVTDNLTGIQRLVVQIDERAWAPVALTGGNRPDFPTSASWSYAWRLPPGDAAQGRHTVRVRAFDRANNTSPIAERAITVDVLPPTDGLTNGRFLTDPPSYRAGQNVDLSGFANDAGNAPAAPRPAPLSGELGSLADATVWLSPGTVADDDAGLSVTWLGDFNGDRLADLAVGMPASAAGAGRIAIVYGRPGGFALPPTPELISASPTTYIGEAGAAIGAAISAVGDTNGDGLDDMLVGDPTQARAHLIFGRRGTEVPDAVLNGAGSASRAVLNGPGAGAKVAAAGDMNGDGFGDLLLGVAGTTPGWRLFLGKRLTNWLPAEEILIQAAAVLAIPLANAPAAGVGDMDGDGLGELVVADLAGAIGAVGRHYLYRGSASFRAAEGRALTAAANFAGSATGGKIAALGDINGDGRADFAYQNGATPRIVFGAASGNGSCCLSLGSYTPAASGFLAAVGNVDADAGKLGDLLIGAADGSAYLLLGQAGLSPASPAPAVAARLTDVAGAASLSALASADANADGSADLVLIPGSAGTSVLATSQLLFGPRPHVDTDRLPAGRTAAPVGPSGSAHRTRPAKAGAGQLPDGGAPSVPSALSAITRYVDDDWAGTSSGADPDGAGPATNFGTNSFATIQTAVNGAAVGDTIQVRPGGYAGFEVTGAAKNDLAIVGDDPDAVFVNGASQGGSNAAAYIHDVTGVSLSQLTLRNADRGLWLLRAGTGGYSSPVSGMGDPALRTELSRVLVQDCLFGIYSDRLSTVSVADSTIAARGPGDRHLQVDPSSPDPALNPAWQSFPPVDLPSGKALGAGGSLVHFQAGASVRAFLGGGSREVYGYSPTADAWIAMTGPPQDVVTGSATTFDPFDSRIYLMGPGKAFTAPPGVRGLAHPGSPIPGPTIHTQVVSGNYIYVGGVFQRAGAIGSETTVNSVGRLDTTNGNWSALGQGLRATTVLNASCPCDALVRASALDSSGNLYVGGYFDQAVQANGTVLTVNGIAKWDGSNWSALGTGMGSVDGGIGGAVVDLATSGTDLYVGGPINTAGGLAVNGVAKWNGSAWSALGGGLTRPQDPGPGSRPGYIQAIVIRGSDVYFGGRFDNTSTDNITRWDGSAYQAVGPASNPLKFVAGIGFLGNELYVSDRDSASGFPSAIYHLVGSTWQDITPTSLGVDIEGDVEVNGGKLYIVPEDDAGPNVGIYDGVKWSLLGDKPTANAQLYSLAFLGSDIYVGGGFSQVSSEDHEDVAVDRFAKLSPTPRLLRYIDDSGDLWGKRANPPRMPAAGSTLAADGTGCTYATFGGGTQDFACYQPVANAWVTLPALPLPSTTGGTSVYANGRLYLLPGDSSINGSAAFYRFTPSPVPGTWTARASAPFDIAAGADLEWDGGDYLYAVQGGNGRTFARYSITADAWTVLGTGGSGLSTPGGSNPGGGLLREGTTLYFARGGGPSFDQFGPIGINPEKLTLDRVAFVTRENTAAQTWLNPDFLVGGGEPPDFLVGGTGSQWVAGAGTAWTPAPVGAPLPMSTLTTSAAKFLDAAGGVFRVATGTTLTAGYAEPHPDAHVFTNLAACAPCTLPVGNPDRLVWGTTAFDTVQAAINTGAPRVLVHSGSYAQSFGLVTGVQVLGAGADFSVFTPPAGTVRAVARAEGVRGSRLARLTLVGSPSVDGARVEDGATNVTLARSIVRDTGVGVRVQGASTDLELVNNTFVRNGIGLAAETCAPVDVRNTIFSNHTNTAIAHQACAATKLHTYNDYFANAADLKVDNVAVQQPGVGEVFADPAFTQPAAPANDFRPMDGSPVIDAGNPSDPVPPGAGGRVDIGYTEVSAAAFFADDDYCELCENDGLFWQVDAFDIVGDALAAADAEISALGCGLGSVGGVPCDTQWTVGVGPGSYPERVSVPSHVSLIGVGADQVTIHAGGTGSPVRLDSAISAEVRGLKLTGSNAAGAGVLVEGTSNGILISRNLVTANAGDGIRFAGKTSGQASFNTVVANTGAGYLATGAGTWFHARDSIVATNGQGLRTATAGQIFDDYNLVNGNTTNYQDSAATGLIPGTNTILGLAPGFVGGGNYALTPISPALDKADPLAAVPVGGGARADMGYKELTALPLALLLGKEGISAATGNSGIQSVQVGFRRITNLALPVDDPASLPSTWLPTTLGTPNQTASYWTHVFTPASGDGLYRVYSRALDRAGNLVTAPKDQFRGELTLDTALPVVTMLSPASGASTTSPVELRAQVADYVAGMFNVAEFRFEVDGLPVAASWAPEPWDPTTGAARVFRAWVPLSTGGHTGIRAVVVDRAGNQGVSSPNRTLTITGPGAADSTPPTLAITSPADGAAVRSNMTFNGTVSDAGTGVAGVELSLDGGKAWTPATLAAGNWSLAWNAPVDGEFVSFPVRVRARDRTGNVSSTGLSVTIDNQAPGGVVPVTFSLPQGSHVDQFTALTINWQPPQAGSGVASVLLAVDQAAGTIPTTVVPGLSAVRNLNTAGDWYVHVGVADALGNTKVWHFGPWHVGTVKQPGAFLAALSSHFGAPAVACSDGRQSIILDGELHVELNEWVAATEKLATDERSGTGQDLYFTWDGANSYLGWQGSLWTVAGTMYAYFDVAAGGSTTPIPGPGPSLPALPFAADYAAFVDSPTAGGLLHWNGTAWVPESLPTSDFAFAHSDQGGTELRLPWGAPEVTGSFKLFAFALNSEGEPTSVLPTVNATNGPWAVNYAWGDRCNTDPTSGIPVSRLATLQLNSPESALAPWGHDMDLRYVVTVDNPEASPLVGATVQLATTPGLGYRTLAGSAGSCGSCPVGGTTWNLNLASVPARSSATFTVTGRLAAVLTGIDVVTTTARLALPVTPSGASVLAGVFSHRVDSRVPAAGVQVPGGTIGLAGKEVFGDANDGTGIGVDFVEVRVNGGPWQLATGTVLWSKLVVPPVGATSLLLEVRATDYYGLRSLLASQILAVDGVAPDVLSFDVPSVLIGDSAELGGTARDPSPDGGELLRVEVQVDDPNGPWLPATLNTTTGTVSWHFSWDLPASFGTVHQLRARAVDAAGNVGPATTWRQTTTFPTSPVDAGPDQRWPAGLPVHFAGSFTPWGGPAPYLIRWDFGNGDTQSATVTSPTDPALAPTHIYRTGGIYQVTLSVTHDGSTPQAAAGQAASEPAAGPQQGNAITVTDALRLEIIGGDPTAAEILSLTATPLGQRAVVAWTTGPEAGVVGFHVERATSADGPWITVNKDLIPAQGSPAAGRRYDLVDSPGPGTFYYRLAVVHNRSETTWHGPVGVTIEAGGGVRGGSVWLPWVGRR
jgi:hypothetical protein